MRLAMTPDDVVREIARVRDMLSEFEALLSEEPLTALALTNVYVQTAMFLAWDLQLPPTQVAAWLRRMADAVEAGLKSGMAMPVLAARTMTKQ
jgi:hypothetical protein